VGLNPLAGQDDEADILMNAACDLVIHHVAAIPTMTDLMSPAEVKALFLDKLALGDRFYSMGPCDGFNPKVAAGHDESSAALPYIPK
jgi:hypothetical protein